MQRMVCLLLSYRIPSRVRADFLNMMVTVICRQRTPNGLIISAEQK
jgi:hypothetical protein